MSPPAIRHGVSAAALFQGALGLALLFAGREVCSAVFGRGDVEPLASLLGAALLGSGAMNWIARTSTLGGIYGRAVVVANETHFVIGALVLIRHAARQPSPAVAALAAAYVAGALFFVWLLRSPGVARK